jgi:hypothetical protein
LRVEQLISIAAIALSTACNHSSSPGTDAALADAALADAACVGTSTGCADRCQLGNDFGVGRHCTKSGGECRDTPNQLAPYCTSDFVGTPVGFCTRPCADDSQCGGNAACIAGNQDGSGPKGCILDICLWHRRDGGANDGTSNDEPDAASMDAHVTDTSTTGMDASTMSG